jgi:hypothetical protein
MVILKENFIYYEYVTSLLVALPLELGALHRETLSNYFVSVVSLCKPLVRKKALLACEGNLYSFIELLVDSYRL